MVNEVFIRKRITELRLKKGVSEYKMSMDMGHSKSYIQSISSGRSLPSLTELIYMCEYFEITPAEFFSNDIENPVLVNKIVNSIKNMDDSNLTAILAIVEKMTTK